MPKQQLREEGRMSTRVNNGQGFKEDESFFLPRDENSQVGKNKGQIMELFARRSRGPSENASTGGRSARRWTCYRCVSLTDRSHNASLVGEGRDFQLAAGSKHRHRWNKANHIPLVSFDG